MTCVSKRLALSRLFRVSQGRFCPRTDETRRLEILISYWVMLRLLFYVSRFVTYNFPFPHRKFVLMSGSVATLNFRKCSLRILGPEFFRDCFPLQIAENSYCYSILESGRTFPRTLSDAASLAGRMCRREVM